MYILAPPESVAFINNPNPSPDDTNDYTSRSVTYNLTDPNVPKNVTVRCEVLDSRPKATVTWMIGNYASFGVSTHHLCGVAETRIYIFIYITLDNEIVTTNETLFDQECSEQQGLDLDENCFDDAGKAYSVIDVLHYIPKVISSHSYLG